MDAQDGSERVPVVNEVTLRLERPEERLRWDAQMGLHHPLGPKHGAGRGVRDVAECQGQ